MLGKSKKGGGLKVGSAYKMKGFSGFGNSPIKKDKNILLIPEPKNKYDPNAIGVYSKRDTSLIQLGFVIKDKCSIVKENIDNISNIKLIRSIEKNEENLYYYYLVINI